LQPARDQNDASAALVHGQVDEVFRRIADHLRILTLEDSQGRRQVVYTTDGHPFWVVDVGWVKAKPLAAGDRLLEPSGGWTVVVDSVREEHPEGVAVFNLRALGTHTYFVRQGGLQAEPVWVHNTCNGSAEELVKTDSGDVSFRGRIIRAQEDLTHITESDLRFMMESGGSPKNIEGETITLHHVGQNPEGSLWELPASLNDVNNPELHPYGNAPGVGLTAEQRVEFKAWRNSYWQARAAQELQIRGFL
jgi:hypothetical protein